MNYAKDAQVSELCRQNRSKCCLTYDKRGLCGGRPRAVSWSCDTPLLAVILTGAVDGLIDRSSVGANQFEDSGECPINIATESETFTCAVECMEEPHVVIMVIFAIIEK